MSEISQKDLQFFKSSLDNFQQSLAKQIKLIPEDASVADLEYKNANTHFVADAVVPICDEGSRSLA